ncbi:hypothetical protein POJ06DRAFT_256787 [Lipomyces tetrasporus]|uniref:YCII-related domain-containing protein n=1 Tax=Lipomyces tetrasporus TaxID=54092 RepID=A0AAD7VQX6_9ASCO|nr:uncharacterized protein POJ06DRAFT_256787 [Lipomyces tetrasporus]KAJ8099367.1 hypothetical protein POJ06DRAFT_256787 [Lipomyces tetrasporus]
MLSSKTVSILKSVVTQSKSSVRRISASTAIRSGAPINNLTRRQLFSVATRAMSEKYEYVAIIPDKADALERRVAVRAKHLENVKKMFADGTMVSGGVYMDGPVIEGTTPSFKGSVVNIIAESVEQVKEILSIDPYTVNDVWDWEKAQIFNFVCAVRKGKP